MIYSESENLEPSKNPLAVVNGASSGIGYELAKVFAKNGFDLVIAAENVSIHDAANMIRTFGKQVHAVQADLAASAGVEALYRAVQSLNQPVDSLVLNAGVGVSGEFINNRWEDELNLIHLNIISPLHLAKLVLKDMLIRRQGKILLTSSIAAEMQPAGRTSRRTASSS